jgi:hypothetical protein
MRKKFNKQLFFSIFFFLIFIGVVLANEFDVFKSFTTVPVVMAKETIEKDKVIQEEDVWIYQMPRDLANEQMFKAADDVIGRTATQVILPTQYISAKSLDQSVLRPSSEHEFFSVPNSWIVNIQGTLRRYDVVNISALYVGKKGEEKMDTSTSNSKIKNDFILTEVPVAYVKGSRNEEVISTGDSRLYGTQNPSNIELSLTLEQFKELEALYLEGYQFVFSY